ncbi:ATP-binding protein [Flavobacterium aciduliphilum]|uniref:Histidine kinase/DNA gyrase B/HSP90-like ATPase n=1 Tax=Flavobacterium aciduliphilum TaxID=1101402 RepID=A0A328YHY7_9FLAO|nr:ATP-binding protein [Flavobacterium aciduliphilum]RAR73708.1 histidine kinase/DNA gyrase B/HSP90-like ATPase [Flavobacterium aciduliphilum]
MKSIIGPRILEKLRSSDYKNTVYALAEIIDNSIDAEAKNIDVITITKDGSIRDIYFVDNGNGMNESILQNCVIFSESNNPPGIKNTGFFGMGLPNSSLSQCTKFSVSSNINGTWMQNSVDIKQMIASNTLDLNPIYKADIREINNILEKSKIEKPKTIIHWTNLDKIDTVRPQTLMDRCERLIGRIHRYKINNGHTINFLNYSDGNKKPDIDHIFIENDPLYLTKGKSQIASKINILAKVKNSENPEFSLDHYFSKYITSDIEKVHPLFYCPEEAQQTISIKWNGKTYTINLKLAVAYKDVQKPGTREGGKTLFGKELGAKVRGNSNYPSGNISWVRNDREITCGNYSLFNVTQENQRFWSIELNYDTSKTNDNVLDKLLGLSNSKQSLKYTPDTEHPIDESETANENNKRQELIARITNALNDAIQKANKILSQQAREWKAKEDLIKGTTSGGGGILPGGTPTTYKVLLEALGKGALLSEQDVEILTTKLKKYLPFIEKSMIESAVRKYSEIGLQNLIIYCELDERDLFQTDKYQGINITLINTKHLFYSKIIEPLKEKNDNDILVSVELLISSLSRAGENNYFDRKKEDIKELFELTSKDLKNLLNQQSTVGQNLDDDIEDENVLFEEDNIT